MRSAYPYRDLTRENSTVLRMLSEGFSTKRGRRGALLHHDAGSSVRARRRRAIACPDSGGASRNADYRWILDRRTFTPVKKTLRSKAWREISSAWERVLANFACQLGTVVVECHGSHRAHTVLVGEAPGEPERQGSVSSAHGSRK